MVKQEPLPTHDGRPGERGSVVNIASQLGVVGRPNARKFSPCISNYSFAEIHIAAYCSSKAAVIGMTKCDAIDASCYCLSIYGC